MVTPETLIIGDFSDETFSGNKGVFSFQFFLSV